MTGNQAKLVDTNLMSTINLKGSGDTILLLLRDTSQLAGSKEY